MSTELLTKAKSDFMFDINSSFRPRTTARCHNALALKKDYRTFEKKVNSIIDYLSKLTFMHSVPDDVNSVIKQFLGDVDLFMEILSISIDGITSSEREDVKASIKSKMRFNPDKEIKRKTSEALIRDDIHVNALCKSFNIVINSINESMDRIDELIDHPYKINRTILNGVNEEIKNISALSIGANSVLYNLVSSMSKYKMNYKDGNLLVCLNGKKSDIINIKIW